MDTEKCKVLITAIDSGSLTDAADRLGYTVSGVSRIIMSLEEKLGFSLIIRDRKGIKPTKDCLTLLPHLRELCHVADGIEEIAAGIVGLDYGTIRIGTAYRRYIEPLTELIIRFTEEYPNIRVEITEALTTNLLEDMRQHKLDMVIGSKREGDYDFIPLEEYEVFLMLNRNNPLARERALPISVIETEPYIHTYPNQESDDIRLIRKHRIHPNTKYTTTDEFAAYKMVQAGLGIGFYYRTQGFDENSDVVLKSIKPKETEVLGLAFPKGDALAPSSVKFISFAKDYYGIK